MKHLLPVICLAMLLFSGSVVHANPPGHESCPTTTEMIDSWGGAVILDVQGDDDEGDEEDDENKNEERDSDDE